MPPRRTRGREFESSVTPPLDAAAFDASAQAPLDEAQALGEHEHAPSTEDLAAYGLEVGAAPTEVPAHDAGEELAALERATTVPDGTRRPRTPLTGPTLDDVMSRAWEGLVTGLPAACPVCRGRGGGVVRRVGARQLRFVRDDDRIASGTR